MLYIKEISKDKKYIKVIYSVERKDIEFIWQSSIIINAIKNGRKYKTVYEDDGKLLEGSDVHVLEGHESNGRIYPDYLTTFKNDILNDNLSELPTF